MSERTSCIQRPPAARTIALRQEYIGICKTADYPNCAAMLLSLFEHWTNFKFELRDQVNKDNEAAKRAGKTPRPLPSLWVSMSQEQIKTELFGLFGETIVGKSLQWLREQKFIATRNNRVDKWDRRLQYLFRINMVQKALFAWAKSDDAPEQVRTSSMSYKYGMHTVQVRNRLRTNRQAITQESLQVSPQNTTTTTVTVTDPPKLVALSAPVVVVDQSQSNPVTDEDKAKVFSAYQSNIGLLTPMLADDIKDALKTYPVDWIVDAIGIAVKQNARKWNYILGVLKRWERDGKTTANGAQQKPQPPKLTYIVAPPPDDDDYVTETKSA